MNPERVEMNSIFNINVCRVCMENDRSCDLTVDKGLLEKFEFTTRLQIAKEDNLPKCICSKCTSRLKVAYNFIKSAHETENNLKNFIEKISVEFKEVSEGNNSCKKFLHEQQLSEDDLLSLMNEENQEEIATCTDVDNKFDVNNIHNLPLKIETSYRFSKDILLTDASNEIHSTFENNSNFMKISTQDQNGEKQSYNNEEVEEDHTSENNQTYTGISILESDQNSEIRCQSVELAIEKCEENHEYDMIINSQDDTIQCQSIYIDESSIEATDQNVYDDDININNFNEEDEDNYVDDEIIEHKSSERHNIVHRFYCNNCNRDFSTKTNLNRHMLSHEGNKPFSCTECKKSFSQKSTLKQHMYTHTGERPYVCEVCSRGFTQCKSLIFHMRRHTGEKPFHCEYCLITFRQKDALRVHILKHHVIIERLIDGTEIFSCIICQKKFETNDEFKTHMKIHTATSEVGIQDEEDLDRKISKQLNDSMSAECFNAAIVNIHASSAAEPSRAKKFQCRSCFKCFALKRSLALHMRIHNHKIHECLDCNIEFSSTKLYQQHLLIYHQYSCSACPAVAFKTFQELKMHMIEHEFQQQEK